MSQHGSYGIEDTYRGVISDVIVQVREAFLDEGVDVDVLQQLKKTWETKLIGSGAVEFDGASSISGKGGAHQQQQLQAVQQVSPPALRQPATATIAIRQQHQPRQQTVARPNAMAVNTSSHLSSASQPLLTSSGQQQITTVSSQSTATNLALTSTSTTAADQPIFTTQPQQNIIGTTVMTQQQQFLSNTMATELNTILQHTQHQQQIQNAGFPLLGFPAQLRTASIENSNILQPSALRLVPGTQYAIMDGPGGAQNLILLATAASGQINPSLANIEQPHHSVGIGGGGHAPIQFVGQPPNMRSMVTTGPIGGKFLHTQQQQQQQRPTTVAMKMESGSGIGQLPQLDGGGQCRRQIHNGIGATNMTVGEPIVRRKNDNSSRHKQLKKSTNNSSANQIVQLDGGKGKTAAAPGMTDESSEEEDREDEEDPTLTAIKYGLSEEHNEVEAEEDEEPLNSGDDQSDDEDLDTLFDADNVVVCQFEKVHRARNKWKFTLKDGVMQIRGKDYCFQKCTGEAEW